MIEVRNINVPGRSQRVNRAKYEAMREALVAVLPDDPPGMRVPEAQAALRSHLSDDLFPGGATSGWWLKTVQLDLEAKGIIRRAVDAPVRLWCIRRS